MIKILLNIWEENTRTFTNKILGLTHLIYIPISMEVYNVTQNIYYPAVTITPLIYHLLYSDLFALQRTVKNIHDTYTHMLETNLIELRESEKAQQHYTNAIKEELDNCKHWIKKNAEKSPL